MEEGGWGGKGEELGRKWGGTGEELGRKRGGAEEEKKRIGEKIIIRKKWE